MSPDEILALDGPALTRLAWECGLAPEHTCWVGDSEYWQAGLRLYSVQKFGRLTGGPWQPHMDLAQADAIFRSLRLRGFTTSCCFFTDDRQYGEVWAGTEGRIAWSARWPGEVETEAMALLLVSVLAVASTSGQCTHDASALVSGREGTNYCGACEAAARARENPHG